MDDYRKGVGANSPTILNPSAYATEQAANDVAQQLQFEQAAKIKAKLDQVNQFGKSAFAMRGRSRSSASSACNAGHAMDVPRYSWSRHVRSKKWPV